MKVITALERHTTVRGSAALEVTSASTPEGRSTESTGADSALIAVITASANSCVGEVSSRGLNPVPKIASRMRSAPARLRAYSRATSSALHTTIGRRGSRANIVAASAFNPSAGPSNKTSTTFPDPCKRRAATNPSPPLFPLPQTTVIRFASGQCSRAKLATSPPAFSISVSEGTPWC